MRSKSNRGIFVVIPSYNEEVRLPPTLSRLKKNINLSRVIVVDDGSVKPVRDFLPPGVIVARHKVNLGKGMALKTGCDLAVQMGAKVIILMDADGQHDPRDLPKFLACLEKGDQFVFGARYVGKHMPLWRLLGNRLLNRYTAYLFGLKLHDVWCGYRAFRSDIYHKIAWESDRYSSDVEMAVRVGLAGLRHSEVFVGTIYHEKGSVTGTTLHDGLKLLFDLTIWRLGFI